MARKKRRATVCVCICVTCQQHPYSVVAEQHRAINRVWVTLDERNRRRFVGLLALQWGRGSIQQLIDITGLSRNTIVRGREEIAHPQRAPALGRVRRTGGGRIRVEKSIRTF
jgi:hypothetical protein